MSIEHVRGVSDEASSIGSWSSTQPASPLSSAIWSGAPARQPAIKLWRALGECLHDWRANWQSVVDTPRAIPSSAVARFDRLSDATIFKAFAIAAISGNARWDRISAVQHELAEPFQDFAPDRFAALTDRDIDERIVPWFKQRRAGSTRLPSVLKRLRGSAELLQSGEVCDARTFLKTASNQADGSPEGMAVLLGTVGKFKMPGFGIPLAAEALRLLGCDLCKPDRHVSRATAAWQFVKFKNWPPGEFAAPQASTSELLATMLAVRQLALANEVSTSYATSVIWLAGSVSGARLTNSKLARLRP